MEFYWVNVGTTITEVLRGNFLWAPEASNSSSVGIRHLDHWDNVATVRAGDVIFCCHESAIAHIAVAKKDAYKASRPSSRSFSEWGDAGHRVDVELNSVRSEVHRDKISTDFISLFDDRCSPRLFTRNATLKQIYMAHLPKDAAVYLLEATSTLDVYEDRLITEGSEGKKPNKTTRTAIIEARVGQGKFRTDLLSAWGARCSLTGLSNVNLLVASHIHAWSLSTNDQRIDPDNGLLLASHMDRLFDRGLISFDDGGKLLVSNQVAVPDQRVLGLDVFTSLRRVTVRNREYLGWHRQRHGFED